MKIVLISVCREFRPPVAVKLPRHRMLNSARFQPAGRVRRRVSDENVRAGAAHGQQTFQRHRALVNPALAAAALIIACSPLTA